MIKNLFSLTVFIFAQQASAMTLDWSGLYRFEWVQVDKPSLNSSTPQRKAYGLNYLGLRTQIIASDGVEVHAKFDVLANQDAAYSNSQLGQLWGAALPATNPAPTNSNVNSQSKQPTGMNVSELYLTVQQENGSLLVGRAPYEFGLGTIWHAGRGAFDHWSSNSDLVAYKFIVGNLSFMPLFARVSAENAAQANTVQDERFQFVYENEETGSLLGAVLNRRKSSTVSNDYISGTSATLGGVTVNKTGGYNVQTSAFTLGRTWSSFKFRMEAGFLSGFPGLAKTNGEDIKVNGYGIAIEMDFPRPEATWDMSLRLGLASGDDPTTADFEGYSFHRNYDVAFLLFNHRLGLKDFLGTSRQRETATHGLDNSFDDETISNATYLSPRVRYAWSEKLDIYNTLTYAQLMTNPTGSANFQKDLGFEWDIEAVYKPRSNVRWVNQLGFLFPGAAFKDGASGLDNSFNFGFTTKATISF